MEGDRTRAYHTQNFLITIAIKPVSRWPHSRYCMDENVGHCVVLESDWRKSDIQTRSTKGC
jgi:hypothetical protein